MKTKFPFFTVLALMAGFALMPAAEAQDAPASFVFPPGVDWNNATPDQIADAVFNAVKNNPDAAPDIAVNGLLAANETGRWARPDQGGKQTVDPDGSSGPPPIEEIANVISDAASRANPAMAPQIRSALTNTVSNLPVVPPGGGSGPTGDPGGGPGGGAPPAPAPIPGGGGGGGGGSSASN